MSLHLALEYEGPNASVYTFEGALSIKAGKGTANTSKWRSGSQGEGGAEMCSVSGEMVLQRGTTLRNTPWIYGLAVYTGMNTERSEGDLRIN